ncbi:hypothetical protein P7H12_06055 [Paenibacillus larvae]|nr:hypothetical protein [Paenibacillus larvae]MDT2263268.1 hypothetical protein [Paenibacillus larvae]
MSVRMNKNGNSTIMVTLDSTPLAFAVLYMCYASKQLTEEQFHQAVQQLSAFHKKNIEEQMDTIHSYSPLLRVDGFILLFLLNEAMVFLQKR